MLAGAHCLARDCSARDCSSAFKGLDVGFSAAIQGYLFADHKRQAAAISDIPLQLQPYEFFAWLWICFCSPFNLVGAPFNKLSGSPRHGNFPQYSPKRRDTILTNHISSLLNGHFQQIHLAAKHRYLTWHHFALSSLCLPGSLRPIAGGEPTTR